MNTFAIGQRFDPNAFNRDLRIKLYRDIKKIIQIRTINIKKDTDNLLMELSDSGKYKKYFLVSLETMIDIAVNRKAFTLTKNTSILLITQEVCDICNDAPYVLLTDDEYTGITNDVNPIRVQSSIKPDIEEFVKRYGKNMISKHKSELAENIYLVSKDIFPRSLDPFQESHKLSMYLKGLRDYKV